MYNRIHLHGQPFLLARPEVKTTFTQHLNIPMIDTPKKIWRPKENNYYIPIDCSYEIEDGSFDYTNYGKSVFKLKVD